MSLRARLLTSGALGGLSGVVFAVGMLAMLAMPARALSGRAPDLGRSGQTVSRALPSDPGTSLIALLTRSAAPISSAMEA